MFLSSFIIFCVLVVILVVVFIFVLVLLVFDVPIVLRGLCRVIFRLCIGYVAFGFVFNRRLLRGIAWLVLVKNRGVEVVVELFLEVLGGCPERLELLKERVLWSAFS